MLDREKLFPSKYLNVSNFPAPKGAVFEIESAGIEIVGRDREQKLVVHLVGVDKGLIINKTNFETLCALFGEEECDWAGRAIHLKVAPNKLNATPSITASAPPTAKPAPSARRTARPASAPEPEPPSVDEVPLPDGEDWSVADTE